MRLRACVHVALYGLVITSLVACGPPLRSKEDATHALAGASVPATAARTAGAFLRLYGTAADQQPLPEPSITVKGTSGGEAELSVNPVGLVVGLAGRGILFDAEYRDYSVDGVNYLDGKVSVLANFDYVAALNEDPNADFEVSFVGELGVSGMYHDDARLNLKVKARLDELMTRENTTKLRLSGKVTASEQEFVFDDEDVVIDWQALGGVSRSPAGT